MIGVQNPTSLIPGPRMPIYLEIVIRVGPAGWAYKDWNGIVYPSHGRAVSIRFAT
jgi:hypothetical protein